MCPLADTEKKFLGAALRNFFTFTADLKMNNSAHPSDVLSSISGETVLSAWAQEMAFYGPDDNGLFIHPDFDFIQANVLEMRMLSGKTVHFTTAQNDVDWELWPHLVPETKNLISDLGSGFFRTRHIPEFPLGNH
ncbi:hypothetical protein Q1W73_08940 [Asticcacaulis sp. ZE23SCel15]|uniref:hypothetical protein n=1 Tax=Asticcacaulis sp. ZE23SCel15 TaxID=3059027 RepID=UPI00265F7F94|nr:hypothetical protein [Asticcacaulis sp. ZE23SCel15]WKL55833.1 hypothetical protein Q1W73_08940 [Asticcacaulis sp. ZE23SCel15]